MADAKLIIETPETPLFQGDKINIRIHLDRDLEVETSLTLKSSAFEQTAGHTVIIRSVNPKYTGDIALSASAPVDRDIPITIESDGGKVSLAADYTLRFQYPTVAFDQTPAAANERVTVKLRLNYRPTVMARAVVKGDCLGTTGDGWSAKEGGHLVLFDKGSQNGSVTIPLKTEGFRDSIITVEPLLNCIAPSQGLSADLDLEPAGLPEVRFADPPISATRISGNSGPFRLGDAEINAELTQKAPAGGSSARIVSDFFPGSPFAVSFSEGKSTADPVTITLTDTGGSARSLRIEADPKTDHCKVAASGTELSVEAAPPRVGFADPAVAADRLNGDSGPYLSGAADFSVQLDYPAPEGGAKARISGPPLGDSGTADIDFAAGDTTKTLSGIAIKDTGKVARAVALEAVENCTVDTGKNTCELTVTDPVLTFGDPAVDATRVSGTGGPFRIGTATIHCTLSHGLSDGSQASITSRAFQEGTLNVAFAAGQKEATATATLVDTGGKAEPLTLKALAGCRLDAGAAALSITVAQPQIRFCETAHKALAVPDKEGVYRVGEAEFCCELSYEAPAQARAKLSGETLADGGKEFTIEAGAKTPAEAFKAVLLDSGGQAKKISLEALAGCRAAAGEAAALDLKSEKPEVRFVDPESATIRYTGRKINDFTLKLNLNYLPAGVPVSIRFDCPEHLKSEKSMDLDSAGETSVVFAADGWKDNADWESKPVEIALAEKANCTPVAPAKHIIKPLWRLCIKKIEAPDGSGGFKEYDGPFFKGDKARLTIDLGQPAEVDEKFKIHVYVDTVHSQTVVGPKTIARDQRELVIDDWAFSQSELNDLTEEKEYKFRLVSESGGRCPTGEEYHESLLSEAELGRHVVTVHPYPLAQFDARQPVKNGQPKEFEDPEKPETCFYPVISPKQTLAVKLSEPLPQQTAKVKLANAAGSDNNMLTAEVEVTFDKGESRKEAPVVFGNRGRFRPTVKEIQLEAITDGHARVDTTQNKLRVKFGGTGTVLFFGEQWITPANVPVAPNDQVWIQISRDGTDFAADDHPIKLACEAFSPATVDVAFAGTTDTDRTSKFIGDPEKGIRIKAGAAGAYPVTLKEEKGTFSRSQYTLPKESQTLHVGERHAYFPASIGLRDARPGAVDFPLQVQLTVPASVYTCLDVSGRGIFPTGKRYVLEFKKGQSGFRFPIQISEDPDYNTGMVEIGHMDGNLHADGSQGYRRHLTPPLLRVWFDENEPVINPTPSSFSGAKARVRDGETLKLNIRLSRPAPAGETRTVIVRSDAFREHSGGATTFKDTLEEKGIFKVRQKNVIRGYDKLSEYVIELFGPKHHVLGVGLAETPPFAANGDRCVKTDGKYYKFDGAAWTEEGTAAENDAVYSLAADQRGIYAFDGRAWTRIAATEFKTHTVQAIAPAAPPPALSGAVYAEADGTFKKCDGTNWTADRTAKAGEWVENRASDHVGLYGFISGSWQRLAPGTDKAVDYDVTGIGLASAPASPSTGDIYVDDQKKYHKFDASGWSEQGDAQAGDWVWNQAAGSDGLYELKDGDWRKIAAARNPTPKTVLAIAPDADPEADRDGAVYIDGANQYLTAAGGRWGSAETPGAFDWAVSLAEDRKGLYAFNGRQWERISADPNRTARPVRAVNCEREFPIARPEDLYVDEDGKLRQYNGRAWILASDQPEAGDWVYNQAENRRGLFRFNGGGWHKKSPDAAFEAEPKSVASRTGRNTVYPITISALESEQDKIDCSRDAEIKVEVAGLPAVRLAENWITPKSDAFADGDTADIHVEVVGTSSAAGLQAKIKSPTIRGDISGTETYGMADIVFREENNKVYGKAEVKLCKADAKAWRRILDGFAHVQQDSTFGSLFDEDNVYVDGAAGKCYGVDDENRSTRLTVHNKRHVLLTPDDQFAELGPYLQGEMAHVFIHLDLPAPKGGAKVKLKGNCFKTVDPAAISDPKPIPPKGDNLSYAAYAAGASNPEVTIPAGEKTGVVAITFVNCDVPRKNESIELEAVTEGRCVLHSRRQRRFALTANLGNPKIKRLRQDSDYPAQMGKVTRIILELDQPATRNCTVTVEGKDPGYFDRATTTIPRGETTGVQDLWIKKEHAGKLGLKLTAFSNLLNTRGGSSDEEIADVLAFQTPVKVRTKVKAVDEPAGGYNATGNDADITKNNAVTIKAKQGAKVTFTVKLPQDADPAELPFVVKSAAFGGRIYRFEATKAESDIIVALTSPCTTAREIKFCDARHHAVDVSFRQKVDVTVEPAPDHGSVATCPRQEGVVPESTRQVLVAETVEALDAPCNLHSFKLTVTHAGEASKRGKAKDGRFTVTHNPRLTEDPKALVCSPRKVPVLQVIAGPPRSLLPYEKEDEAKFHESAVLLDVNPPSGAGYRYCGKQIVFRGLTDTSGDPLLFRHPLVIIKERTLSADDLQARWDAAKQEQAERGQSGPADIFVFTDLPPGDVTPCPPNPTPQPMDSLARRQDTEKRERWEWTFPNPLPGTRRLRADSSETVNGTFSVYQAQQRFDWRHRNLEPVPVQQYAILVRSCGIPNTDPVDAGGPMGTLSAVVEVFPSDEFCLHLGSPPDDLLHNLGDEGDFFDPKKGFDPAKGFDKEFKKGLKSVKRTESEAQYTPRAKRIDPATDRFPDLKKTEYDAEPDFTEEEAEQQAKTAQEGWDCPEPETPEMIEHVSFYHAITVPPAESKKIDKPQSPYIFYPYEAGEVEHPDLDIEWEHTSGDLDEEEYRGPKGAWESFKDEDVYFCGDDTSGEVNDAKNVLDCGLWGLVPNIYMGRNGKSEGHLGTAVNIFKGLMTIARIVLDVIDNFGNAKPTYGFGVGMKVSFLSGEILRHSGWKECTDHRVFYWRHLKVNATLLSVGIELCLGVGFAFGKVFKFQAMVYGSLSVAIATNQTFETQAPDATDPQLHLDKYIDADLVAELGFRMVLVNESVLSFCGAITSGIKFRLDFTADFQAECYHLGITAKVTGTICHYGSKEFTWEIVKPQSARLPGLSGGLPDRGPDSMREIHRVLTAAAAEIESVQRKIKMTIRQFQQLQLHMYAQGRAPMTDDLPGHTPKEPSRLWRDNKALWDQQWDAVKTAYTEETIKVSSRHGIRARFTLKDQLGDRTRSIESHVANKFQRKLEELDRLWERYTEIETEFMSVKDQAVYPSRSQRAQMIQKAESVNRSAKTADRDMDFDDFQTLLKDLHYYALLRTRW